MRRYRIITNKYHKTEEFCAGEMYSMICVEWAADHFGLGYRSTFDEDMSRKRFSHFHFQ